MVTDSVSGKPVGRVLVTSVDRRLATLTDSEGRFSLEVVPEASAAPGGAGDVPPGATGVGGPSAMFGRPMIYLNAQRPGYLTPEAPTGVPVEGNARDVRLQLVPEGTIAGRVFTEGDAPARGVTILLAMHAPVDGERRWSVAEGRVTGADGRFHFHGLRAGEYTVLTTEWSGEEPLMPMQTSLTRQYPPDFLGDARTLAGASPLLLHAGEDARAELHLRREPYYPVSIPVVGAADRNVSVQVLGPGDISPFSLGINQGTHAIEGALPDGDYLLLLRSFGAEQAFARTSLHVAGAPVHAAPVTLATPAPIRVRLHPEWTTQPPGGEITFFVNLRSMEGNMPSVQGASSPEHPDELTLTGAAPGRYSVQVLDSHGYAASARCGAADLAVEPLLVAAAGVPCAMDVTLRDDGGTVSGTVETGGAALPPQASVFLLPPTLSGQPLQGLVTSDGRFAIPDVPPGPYRVFATATNPATLAWRETDVLDRLNGKGVPVTVAPAGTVQVTVPLVDSRAPEAP